MSELPDTEVAEIGPEVDYIFDGAQDDGVVYMINFSAPWCGPCRQFFPIYQELALKHADVRFSRAMVEGVNPAILTGLGIQAVPTFMAVRNGKILFRQAGASKDGIVEFLESQNTSD